MACNPNILNTIAIMTIMLYSCDNKTVDPENSNEIIAEIVDVTPGHTLNFKATGTNAELECDIYGVLTSINGTDVNNANANIEILVPQCVTSAGTYAMLNCFYDRNKIRSAHEPDFTAYRGIITFTKVDGKYIEGNFNAVLYCDYPYNQCDEKDSVIVSGTFKGNKIW
jgi:hypothetical protein